MRRPVLVGDSFMSARVAPKLPTPCSQAFLILTRYGLCVPLLSGSLLLLGCGNDSDDPSVFLSAGGSSFTASAGDEGAGDTGDDDSSGVTSDDFSTDSDPGDGDGDPTTGDGDSSPGDGDGDPSTSGDGDGDPSTSGDGDGDPSTTSGDGDGDGDPSTTSGDGDGDPTTTSGDGDGDGDPTTSTSGDGDGDGDPTTTSGTDGTTGDADVGCEKADFLFVIDNSGSMGDEQQNLVDSFPGFLTTIQNEIEATDYHIMVVDSDAGGGSGSSSSCSTFNNVTTCTCSPAPDCCVAICNTYGPGATCNGAPACNQPVPDDCEVTLGAGRWTSGNGGSDCFAAPPAYLNQSSPDLNGAFACTGLVGTTGDGNERPMNAMTTAVGAAMNAGGACNEGFLRDDALLIVTFISDEEDNGSSGTPGSWYDEVVAAKGGNDERVVVLGLFGDNDQPNPVCTGNDADPGPKLRQFTQMWPYNVIGSVCEPNYSPFLSDAVATIDLACTNFPTPE